VKGINHLKPIIGISSSLNEQVLTVPTEYIQAITKFGGVPLILPNVQKDAIDSMVQMLDGLLLTGGGDIDPTLFNEEPHQHLGSITPERDEFEIAIIHKMLKLNKPILGICRGMQILNIAIGGDMFQDIYTQSQSKLLQHAQVAPRNHASHFVKVTEGSMLSDIVQVEKIKVNSFHHQAIREIPSDFKACAIASDGIIEAFESTIHSFVMGLQWHPECLLSKNDLASTSIFKAFILSCEK
jgi:putative glutamine amidotransferase